MCVGDAIPDTGDAIPERGDAISGTDDAISGKGATRMDCFEFQRCTDAASNLLSVLDRPKGWSALSAL